MRELRERGDEVTALSRDAERAPRRAGRPTRWTGRTPRREPPPAEALRGRDAVVHLLGEPVAQRWTDDAKREIRDSRVLATRNLVAALARAAEARAPAGAGLAVGDRLLRPPRRRAARRGRAAPATTSSRGVVVDWEAEARAAEELGVRVVLTRTGVVLSDAGGALEKMLPFFKLGIGGPVAGGRQYVPWVHLDDVVGALAVLPRRRRRARPVNVTAPEPVTNKELLEDAGPGAASGPPSRPCRRWR